MICDFCVNGSQNRISCVKKLTISKLRHTCAHIVKHYSILSNIRFFPVCIESKQNVCMSIFPNTNSTFVKVVDHHKNSVTQRHAYLDIACRNNCRQGTFLLQRIHKQCCTSKFFCSKCSFNAACALMMCVFGSVQWDMRIFCEQGVLESSTGVAHT